jgi:hypothetical protein
VTLRPERRVNCYSIIGGARDRRIKPVSNALFAVMKILEEKRIHFSIARNNPTTVDIFATLLEKRIEIYVNEDGTIDFSVFHGSEDVTTGLDALIKILDED